MRVIAVLGALVLLTSRAVAAPPADEAGFTEYMRGLLQAHAAPDQKLSSDRLLHVSFRNAGATVDVEFGPVYRMCSEKPADCEFRIGEFVDYWAEHYGRTAAPDRARLYAAVWLERNFTQLLMASAGIDPVMAKFKGRIWTVCMNDGRPLPRTALKDLGMKADEAVRDCMDNTVARQAPFEGAIADMPRGEIRKIAADGESTLVLMHDLWGPVAKRFDGELIVCVASSNTFYYGRGASPGEVAAIEARAKQDAAEATSEADHRPRQPDDFRFDVLRWTESGWDIAN
jgi:hypothetical protein